jgi:hypothetical protein
MASAHLPLERENNDVFYNYGSIAVTGALAMLTNYGTLYNSGTKKATAGQPPG